MTTRPVRRHRDEKGAVAIMVAILAVLLLIAGALAVDIGNAWARKRDMQTQADVAALAGANWARDQLPVMWPADTSAEQGAITLKVAEYIVKDNNNAIGMTKTTVPEVVAALTDGDQSNGDIEFFDGGKQMRLVPPPSRVNFGMASVFYDSVDVTAAATVAVKSEIPGQDVVPLWIPQGCSFGAVEADTTGGPPPASTTGDFPIDSMSPSSAARGATGVTVTLVVKKSELAAPPITVTLTHSDGVTTVTKTSSGYSESGPDATFTITLGTEVTANDSTWAVRVNGRSGKVSQPSTFTVGAGSPATDPTAGCAGPDRGNFGQLNSPRNGLGMTARNTRLELNMREGLDHQIVPHPNATQDSCEGPALPNSQHDDVYRNGNNCIQGDTGNDGPAFAQALFGSGGTPGRLAASNGNTFGGAGGGCAGRSNITIDGKVMNNDVVSCYLNLKPDGVTRYTLSDIAQPTATRDMLDPRIVDSPRFVWIPVVRATDRSVNTFQPIIKFVPGLITSENMTTSADAFDAANGWKNGVECNGGGGNCNSISTLRIFTFNPRAVPFLPDSPVADYDPTIGREVVRLVG